MTSPATDLVPLEALDVTKLPDPEQVLDYYSKAARALTRVIESQPEGQKNKFVTDIEGKQYLGFEAWQTIARFNGCHIETESVEPLVENGEVVAYRAWAILVHDATGVRVGRASMECAMDAFPVKSRLGRDKDKAAQSAAQTWAGSKACRMVFAFISVLAGYQATTAEEMDPATKQVSGADQASEDEAKWGRCPIHDQPFFKSDNMRSPAHKTEAGGWCNYGPGMWAKEKADLQLKIGWTDQQLTTLCKEVSGNRHTWSSLHFAEVEQVLSTMRGLASDAQPAAEAPAAAPAEPEAAPEPPEGAQTPSEPSDPPPAAPEVAPEQATLGGEAQS